MVLNRRWTVVVDAGHVSVVSNNREMKNAFFMPAPKRHHIDLKSAGAYLEEALANHRYSSLMLVGAPEDVTNFRKTLNAQVQTRVVAEVIRPHHTRERIDERIEAIYA